MRYLVVGGTSIFGEDLIDSLLAIDNTNIVIASKLPGESIFSRDRLEWKDLDLRDIETTNRVIKESNADIIFDLATQDSVGYSWDNPTETVDINVTGTINLLNAIRDYCPNARIIIGGSAEEYGSLPFSLLPAKEETTSYPSNIYGATKVCQTMFAQLYHQAYGLDIIVLRTFYETSIKQDEKFAVSSFCKQFAEIEAGKRKAIIYTGNLNNERDFTDVYDLVRAFLLVANEGRSGEVYNAARGKKTSLLDVVRILERKTGIKVEICVDSERVRPMDSPSVIADTSKINRDTGWTAEIAVEDTIEKLLNYWRQNLK